MLSGSADAMLGGFLNVEGVDLAQRGKRPARHPGRPARHPDLRRARPGRQRRPRRRRPGAHPPVHRGARARHPRRRARPAGRDRGDPRRRRRPRAEADRAPRSTGRCRCSRRTGPQPVRLHGPARVGAVRRLLRRPRPDLDAGRRPRRCSPTTCCQAGCRTSDGALGRSGGEAQRRPRGDRAVPAGERERAGEAAKRRVGREELLDLLDRRAAAEPDERPTSFT